MVVSSSSASTTSTARILSPQETTRLVDEVLRNTKALMEQQRSSPHHQHVVAFSGGVDSSLVLALLQQLHDPSIDHVRAVLGLSPAVPHDQRVLAEQVADHIGVDLWNVATSEGSDELYVENAGQACLACKTNLYTTLQAIVDHVDEGAVVPYSLYNGTNADDVQDPTRLGLIAADRFHVQSPLRPLTKPQVRTVAKHLGLPNWNYAASPCLRSRLALGVPATQAHLERVEQAETYVRQQLELSAMRNLRVRLLAGNRACIEIDGDLLETVQSNDWDSYFVDELGFSSVHSRAFKSGSVAVPESSSPVMEATAV